MSGPKITDTLPEATRALIEVEAKKLLPPGAHPAVYSYGAAPPKGPPGTRLHDLTNEQREAVARSVLSQLPRDRPHTVKYRYVLPDGTNEYRAVKLAAMRDELLKIATVGGAVIPEYVVAGHPGISASARKTGFQTYLKHKAEEAPTTWTAALGAGGLLGTIPGAITGAALKGYKGAVIGTGIGAGMGMLTATILRHVDKKTIEEARRIIKRREQNAALANAQARHMVVEGQRQAIRQAAWNRVLER